MLGWEIVGDAYVVGYVFEVGVGEVIILNVSVGSGDGSIVGVISTLETYCLL